AEVKSRRRHPFEGILPNLTRRYRETESQMVREELARYLGVRPCPECQGTRLNRAARHVFVADRTLPQLTALTVGRALEFLGALDLAGWRGEVAARIVRGVIERLRFLADVGLDYLTLDRNAETLSGGESQRIRLASQVGSGLTGVMYILDEPSIGLHQRDNRRLLATLKQLRDLGNTVIVVEHDEEAIREADHVVDLGPGAGAHGGHLVAQGTPRDIAANPASVTGQYLAGRRRIAVPGSGSGRIREPGTATRRRPARYWPVTEAGLAAMSRGVPCATRCPPCAPAPGPRSTTWSASRIASSSCSTTITVLPRSRSCLSVARSRRLSRWCRPIEGSSRMYMTPVSPDPTWLARRMRCDSPPESVSALRSSVR